MREIWLPVIGYEGMYEVSNKGRIRGLDRVIPGFRPGVVSSRPGQIRKPKVLKSGHLTMALSKMGVRRDRLVHHLVLEAFDRVQPKGLIGCHRDDDPTNNTAENLYWGTQSMNQLDSVSNGSHVNTKKTQCPKRHPYDTQTLRNGRIKRGCSKCARDARIKYESKLKGNAKHEPHLAIS